MVNIAIEVFIQSLLYETDHGDAMTFVFNDSVFYLFDTSFVSDVLASVYSGCAWECMAFPPPQRRNMMDNDLAAGFKKYNTLTDKQQDEKQFEIQFQERFVKWYHDNVYTNSEPGNIAALFGSMMALAGYYQFKAFHPAASEAALRKAEPLYFELLDEAEGYDLGFTTQMIDAYSLLGLDEDAIRVGNKTFEVLKDKYGFLEDKQEFEETMKGFEEYLFRAHNRRVAYRNRSLAFVESLLTNVPPYQYTSEWSTIMDHSINDILGKTSMRQSFMNQPTESKGGH